jgi:hypothetical protein
MAFDLAKQRQTSPQPYMPPLKALLATNLPRRTAVKGFVVTSRRTAHRAKAYAELSWIATGGGSKEMFHIRHKETILSIA